MQPFRWRCVDCVIHHERDVREEQKHICVARASNSKRGCEHDLYCCLLPRCETWRTCHSGFPIATIQIAVLCQRICLQSTVLNSMCILRKTMKMVFDFFSKIRANISLLPQLKRIRKHLTIEDFRKKCFGLLSIRYVLRNSSKIVFYPPRSWHTNEFFFITAIVLFFVGHVML